MDFYKVPIGFGMALAQNTAAMNRYAHLTEDQKQEIIDKARDVRSEREMYSLIAALATAGQNNTGRYQSPAFYSQISRRMIN